MATVNGARALGRNTGVIAPGKTADLILVDLDALNLFPCHDVEEDLVYSARGSNVVMNMARGRVIYEKESSSPWIWKRSARRWRVMPCPGFLVA